LEKEIPGEMQERIVKSFFDVLILAQLRREPKSAYDIVAFIHKKFHILMSTGTVYSTLYSLERDGLIQGNRAEGKRRARVYTLTEKGEKTIRAFLKVNDRIQLFVANLLSSSRK
jgi:DNA-binding PadR family transcriptional regulator